MIDFHSHIMPGIDDGARDVNMSLEMLRRSKLYGVDTIVSTSHCYLDRISPKQFLEKRSDAYNILKHAAKEAGGELPDIVLGAEVYWNGHMSELDDLSCLCIGDTNYILIEMPYSDWSDEVFEELYHVIRRGFKPILAHLDRFFSKEKYFPELLSLDVLCQINADSFFESKLRRKILQLFSRDAAHVIGSDMHNITSRPQNIAEAYDIISKKFGTSYAEFLQTNARIILSGGEVPPTRLPKLTSIQQLFL